MFLLLLYLIILMGENLFGKKFWYFVILFLCWYFIIRVNYFINMILLLSVNFGFFFIMCYEILV